MLKGNSNDAFDIQMNNEFAEEAILLRLVIKLCRNNLGCWGRILGKRHNN